MDSLTTLTPAVQVELQLGWNTYLLFNSDSELCVKSRRKGDRKHCFYNVRSLAVVSLSLGDVWCSCKESLIQG